MLQQDDFAPISTKWTSAGYNAHYKLGEHSISVSYGGMCYGKGFWIRPNGQTDGTFEVCVWNNKTDETVLSPEGDEVHGWMTLEQVNDLLLHYSSDAHIIKV